MLFIITNYKGILIKSTLSVLSISLSATFLTTIYADIATNPVVNPTNPTQTIQPKDNDNNQFVPHQPEKSQLTSSPKADVENPVIPNNITISPTKLSQTFNHTDKHNKRHKVDQNTPHAVLPTYEFDIAMGGNDDIAINSTTGYILAAMTGTMLIGR